MKIGVIGPKSSCVIVKRSIYEIDEKIEVRCYEKESVNTCHEVIEEAERECNAILFTGCAIESYISGVYEMKRPHAAIEKSIISVSGAFLEMQKANMEIDAFSIDVVETQVIEDLLDAFQIKARNIYSSSFKPGVAEQEYVNWHMQLQKEGKTNVALTAFAWVYNRLKENGFHVIYLEPTRAMVRLALERLKSQYVLNKAEYSQIAVEILQLTNHNRLRESYYTGMLEKTDVEKEIIRYVESVQGSLFPFGRREYIVFTNAGTVRENGNQNRILELQETVQKLGIKLNVGLGTGVTAYEAETNARKALEYTLKKGKQEVYAIDAKDILTGPIGRERQLQYELISSDPKIQKISQETGLSANSILKIMAIAEVRKSFIFDAHELAGCLEVTPRSARRIMNKIIEAGYGKVYAKETTVSGGRPKTVIQILFE